MLVILALYVAAMCGLRARVLYVDKPKGVEAWALFAAWAAAALIGIALAFASI